MAGAVVNRDMRSMSAVAVGMLRVGEAFFDGKPRKLGPGERFAVGGDRGAADEAHLLGCNSRAARLTWSRQPRGRPAGLPDRPLANRPRRSRTPCSPCFIWSRSGIANSYNDNPAPVQGADVC